MSKYHLTEAYGNLYNPRKADETFYENLRFVDYLMQEEIEEVMESLLWEFMDYGNTLDESYDLIESVFSDDVILEEVISEAYEDRYPELKKQEARAKQAAKSARREARKAAVTGALRAAKETIGKIASGVRDAAVGGYRGAKQMAGAAYTAGRQGAGEAKAGLQKLVRKGAAAAIKQGRAAERAGEQARRQAQTAAGGASYSGSSALERSRARTAGLEAAGKTGSKRRAIGNLLQRAGKAVAGAMKSRMSRGDYEQRKANRAAAARQAADDVVASSGRPHGPFQQSTTRPQGPFQQSTTRPQGPFQQNTTKPQGPKAPPAQGPRRATSVASSSETSTSTRKRKPKRTSFLTSQRAKLAAQRSQREEFELLAQYIMEDFINEGYADTYEEALEILENLSEGSILELTEMYLEG